MLTGPFLPSSWIGACETFEEAEWVMVGIPYDGTCSYRPGTRFGPEEARLASWGLEDYSPIQDKEITETQFYDAGELEFPLGCRDKTLEIIRNCAKEVLDADKKWFGVGGEHLVTLPAIEAYLEKYPDLHVVHFDAHTDLREDYLGEKLSHATVMRRISDIITPARLKQIGIRSGMKEEFQWMKNNNTLLKQPSELEQILKEIGNKPIFVSVDLDVLDPSIMCGTGTPEAGGFTFNEFMEWMLKFKNSNVVGADVVELSPHYDRSGTSTATAAKIIREMLILFG